MTLLAVFLILCVDQLSKYIAVRSLSVGESVPLIHDIFHITLVHNTGAAFGMMSSRVYLFIVIAVVSSGVILYFLKKRSDLLNVIERVALSFILGGALGNLIDRLRLGYVIDFLDFRVWPVFNLADSFITVGAVLMTWSVIFIRKDEKKH